MNSSTTPDHETQDRASGVAQLDHYIGGKHCLQKNGDSGSVFESAAGKLLAKLA